MSVLSEARFHDEAAAFAYVESIVWPDGPVCPFCGTVEKIYDLKGVLTKPSKKHPQGVERHGLKKCGNCKKQFTVRKGTVFEESHLPLHIWLQAMHLLCSSKKGISSHQLARTLDITVKSAWFLSHRIREAMAPAKGSRAPMGGAGKVVEADETYFGQVAKPRKRTRKGKRFVKGKPRGGANKRAVVALNERGGSVRTFHVPTADKYTVTKIVRENIDRESRLHTDEGSLYRSAEYHVAAHETVKHSAEEYVRGDVYSNSVENYFSVFKRGMRGVYQHCAEKHLHRYLAEFDFRYSNRVACGVNDVERTEAAIVSVIGKRLTYRRANQAQL